MAAIKVGLSEQTTKRKHTFVFTFEREYIHGEALPTQE
jgi:hypothetical protein